MGLTAPIVFVPVRGPMAALGLVDAPKAPETLRPAVEVTLVWVLFSDAARVPFRESRRDLGRFLRLLAIGVPLTRPAGWGLATWLFPDLGTWLVLLVAAALAPTDAALGLPVVTNPKVPERIRRLITVEGGLAMAAYAAAVVVHGNGLVAALCRGQPHGRADDSRRTGIDRFGPRATSHAVRRLVRSARTRLPGLRPHRPG